MDQTETTTSTVNDAAASLAFADSSFASPATSETTPAAAVTPPAESAVPVSEQAQEDPRSPFIPRARFDEVNTRLKAAEDAAKQYEWAKEYQPDEMQSVAQWARALKANPVEAALHLLSTLETDPQHASALRSHFARTLGTRKQAEPAADPEPEADLQSQDGTLVYSAARQREWREWNNRQLTAQLTKQFEEKLRPIQGVAESVQAERATNAYTQATRRTVDALKAEHKEFEAHMGDVWKAIAADPMLHRLALDQGTADFALRSAWDRVRLSTVVPQQLKSSEAQTLANLQQRAVAATTNPAAASTATPKNVVGDARAALEYANQQLGVA